ncbi:MAG: fibronectin type III domain-containing protein [Oscillospiraceae bacterium]|nr:fibronectin type III domain-containing protein [Oscillospiraceae bacterium]
MKKLLAMLLAGLMLASVMSVAAFGLELPDISEISPEEGRTIYALVIDIREGSNGHWSLDLCKLDLSNPDRGGLNSASISDDTELLNAYGAITADDISMGDIVALTYTGVVFEVSPGIIEGTTRVYVVDHVDTLAEIEDLLPSYYTNFGDYFPSWNVFASIPESLDCTTSDGKVTLSWRNTSDETYIVYWKRSSSSEWKIAGMTTKHKVNIIGLKSGVSYDFKVEILGQDSEIATITAE